MRTISEPARASAATCATVPSMSAVSVLVMDWTTIGAPPPTSDGADADADRALARRRAGGDGRRQAGRWRSWTSPGSGRKPCAEADASVATSCSSATRRLRAGRCDRAPRGQARPRAFACPGSPQWAQRPASSMTLALGLKPWPPPEVRAPRRSPDDRLVNAAALLADHEHDEIAARMAEGAGDDRRSGSPARGRSRSPSGNRAPGRP